MNYRDDYRNKIPFYMTYPIQNMYLTEMEYEKDMERMKELYPREVKQLQEMIERRCDEMEYEGSRMYDENPDRYMLEEEARRLYERFIRENPQYHAMRPTMPRPNEQIDPRQRNMPRQDEQMDSRQRNMPRQDEQMDPRQRNMPRPDGQMEQRGDMRMQQYGRYQEDTWLRSLIGILFHDEIYRRRCRNRRCRRWW